MNLEKLKQSREGIWFALDIAMLALLFVNLFLLLFDALYDTEIVKQFFQDYLPQVITVYQPVNDNFLFVDLCFVAVFLSEFLLRWAVAIKHKEYMRWYFFPFVHWYDLIGCIPIESARIFRLLRIVSILYRLHKYQIVDFKNWALFRFFRFYYNVIIEELSDRIVVKILSDAQEDISNGSKLLDKVTEQIITPRKEVVTQWVASSAHYLGDAINNSEPGNALQEHIRKSVAKAVREDDQVGLLNLVPVLGGNLEKRLERTVSNIVINSVTNMLNDLDASTVDHMVNTSLHHFSKTEQELNQQVITMVLEVLELVKEHIAEKRWQETLAERDRKKRQLKSQKD